MIHNELNTSLRFYDDLDKQNRYKSNCASICDFKLLCPLNKILPFQFMSEYDESTVVSNWVLRCASGRSIAIDLLEYVDYISVDNIENKGTFATYLGNPTGVNVPCGDYYLEVTLTTDDGDFVYFSEVITVKEGIEDRLFARDFFPVYVPWAWYSSESKIIEKYEPCNKLCPYTIICGNDALIPFQYKTKGATTISSWILTNGDCAVNLPVEMLSIQVMGEFRNIIYNGEPIDLPCGVYYSEMVINGVTHYSEPILITNDFETNGTNYILQETGDKLLQEDNYGLLHEGI